MTAQLNWMSPNVLHLNSDKTKVLLGATKQCGVFLESLFSYKLVCELERKIHIYKVYFFCLKRFSQHFHPQELNFSDQHTASFNSWCFSLSCSMFLMDDFFGGVCCCLSSGCCLSFIICKECSLKMFLFEKLENKPRGNSAAGGKDRHVRLHTI